MLKKNLLSLILALCLCMALAAPAWASETLDFREYKDSKYFSELEEAYRNYSQTAAEMGKFVEISLEEFVCSYNTDKYNDVKQYLEINKQQLSSCEDIATIKAEAAYIRLRALQEAAKENNGMAPYSAAGYWYYNCPELSRDGVYGKYNLLGDQVATGDIVMDENGVFGLLGHTALVTGHYYSNIFETYYVRVVEAIKGGVCYGILSDDRVDERDSYVYRVNTTTSKRSAAVSFAKSQLGKDYLITGGRENIGPDRENWYCSLLCYASYYNNGVDIGDGTNTDKISPKQLLRSSKLTQTNIGR